MNVFLITPQVRVPLSEFEFTFARSSGPGGQNVNKVNSKAVLRWSVALSPSLSEEARARLLARLHARLTGEGDLVIASDRFRDQLRNREDCLEKLQACVAQALHIPKARKKTKPSRASRRKALQSKKRHSEKKTLRGRVRD